MSMEQKTYGGYLPGLKAGGVTASLQSIGASGAIKPKAKQNLAYHLRKLGYISEKDYLVSIGDNRPLLVIEVPEYFTSPTPELPLLMSDYKVGGYNHRQAQQMLSECRGWDGEQNCPCCCSLGEDEEIHVDIIHRIENRRVFERFKVYEALVAEALSEGSFDCTPCAHDWLEKLAVKNGLSEAANTTYLLHGTTRKNLENICEVGLTTSCSWYGAQVYGKGLYFTPQSCKAFQYAGEDGYILICRVVLGRVQILEATSPERVFPDEGFESAMAAKSHTEKLPGVSQVHDEYIVYNEAAVYPEFVLEVRKGDS